MALLPPHRMSCITARANAWAVTATSDLALHTAPAPAPTTTAIVVADPGPDAEGGLPGSIEAGAWLARAANQTDLRVRLGLGAVHGRASNVRG